MSFVKRWVVSGVGLFLYTLFYPHSIVGNPLVAFAATAAIVALINMFVKPVLHLIALPLSILTFGIAHFLVTFSLLITASALTLASFGAGIVVDGYGAALLCSIAIGIAQAFLY